MRRVKKSHTSNARALRTEMTNAERTLWQAIRQNQLGARFRRQHPIGQYIADFACLTPSIVIEVDGGQHADNVAEDANRTRAMEAKGFHVLRFWNNEVLQNPQGVLQVIARTLASHPHPNLSPQKGKEL